MPAGGVEWLPHDNIMRYEEFLRIVRIFVSRGVGKVRLTGGEPLVRKGLIGFISSLKSLDGLNDLSLTTNGVLLAPLAQDLRQAGLARVNISLDSLDRDKFYHITRVDAFEKTQAGIQAALEYGLGPVKINVVAIRGFNDDEISAFAAMTVSTPVEVRFIELMPMGCGARFGNGKILDSREIKKTIESMFGKMEQLPSGLGPAKVFRIGGAKGSIGLIDAVTDKGFCSRCNRVRITADGHLRPCLFSDYSVDLLGPMRRGISEKGLEELIERGIENKPAGIGAKANPYCTSMMSDIGG
jgi:cyclic pyranopterin phosphate synthase